MSEYGDKLREQLLYKKESAFDRDDESTKVFSYADDYREFLNASKTERDAVEYAVGMLKDYGFKPYTLGMQVYQGDRLYYNNRNKSLIAFVIGSDGVDSGFRIMASHIDSPRLDLKQHPIYEDGDIAYAKTHYYGGLRKYQWTTIPLALHGTVTLKSGENIKVEIGENDSDPVFCITDLLPHLSREQNQKPLSTAFQGEGLNVLLCASPLIENGKTIDGDEKVKLRLLLELYNKYGITESDLISSELCFVPAGKCRDIGLDRALMGGYGHDDKVCAFPALTALLENLDSRASLMVVLADKEETGSDGTTGMQGRIAIDIIEELARSFGVSPAVVRSLSRCLSADVAAAYDPLYPEVFEKRNSAVISCGVAMAKYTGGGGKNSTNDCPAEFVGIIRKIFDDAGVIWQTAEMGKVDAGGGGTVAKYISKYNIDTVDVGVPVLSMHAPFELISKYDLYNTHKALSAFCKS